VFREEAFCSLSLIKNSLFLSDAARCPSQRKRVLRENAESRVSVERPEEHFASARSGPGKMIRGEEKWHVYGCVVAAFNPSRSMRVGD